MVFSISLGASEASLLVALDPLSDLAEDDTVEDAEDLAPEPSLALVARLTFSFVTAASAEALVVEVTAMPAVKARVAMAAVTHSLPLLYNL